MLPLRYTRKALRVETEVICQELQERQQKVFHTGITEWFACLGGKRKSLEESSGVDFTNARDAIGRSVW